MASPAGCPARGAARAAGSCVSHTKPNAWLPQPLTFGKQEHVLDVPVGCHTNRLLPEAGLW